MMPPPIGVQVQRLMGLPTADRYAQRCASRCEPGAVLVDAGCGGRSNVRELAPHMYLVGVDSDPGVLEEARARSSHDEYIAANLAEGLASLESVVEGRSVQMVRLSHVIEHLQKPEGFELLERSEAVSERFVFVDTPNRFQPQGPEWGSEAQRHRSGWFWQDFVGRGYEVRGTGGTRWLRGYAGAPTIPVKGAYSLDAVLARALMIERNPGFAYGLTAWKDVRGVPARLSDAQR